MPYFRALNSEIVAEIKQHGVYLYPWTVDDLDDMQAMIKLGVDGMLTNRPDLLKEIVTQNRVSGTGKPS